MTPRIRVLVADDERPSRSFLVTALSAFVEVEVIAEAKSGKEAVHLIEALSPDVAFLDIHMPDIDGLGVLEFFAGLEAAYRVCYSLRRICRSSQCTECSGLFVEAR
jgi:YesN/AraC family two-component response regulator